MLKDQVVLCVIYILVSVTANQMWRVGGATDVSRAISTSHLLDALTAIVLNSQLPFSAQNWGSALALTVLGVPHVISAFLNTTTSPQLAALHVTVPQLEFVAAQIIVILSLASVHVLATPLVETVHNARKDISKQIVPILMFASDVCAQIRLMNVVMTLRTTKQLQSNLISHSCVH